MNKKFLFLALLITLGFTGCYYPQIQQEVNSLTAALSSPAGSAAEVETFIQDNGSLSLYFCPREECESAFLDFLNSSESSIHCALFEIDLESVKSILLEKAAEMEVKVVTDDQYLKQFNYSFVKADKSGLMHNKFCIIDGKKVSTGSMNPTKNCAHRNNNNLLLINSRLLTESYEEEFQEMWNGTFKKGSKVRNPAVHIGDVPVESYFCPEDSCAERVKEELKKAKHSIYFLTFSFTHQGIANILLLKHLDNLSIKGVMEASQVTQYSMFKQLEYRGIDVVKDKNKGNMHHKFFIVDNQTVITGSFNPTDGGNKNNDENILIIYDEKIAGRFLEEFEQVRKEAGAS